MEKFEDYYEEVTVDSSVTNTTINNGTAPNFSWGTTSSPSFSYTWTTPIYMYQIRCPRCKKMNWAELDKIITCSNTSFPKHSRAMCGARLKAVSEVVDYEVPVER